MSGDGVRLPPAGETAASAREKMAHWAPTYGALAALIVLVVVNMVVTTNFATSANLWNVLLQVSTTVLVAIGMTLVIATGGVDLSVGSVMAVASVVSVSQLGHGAAWAMVAGLLAASAIGVLNGLLVTKAGIAPFIVTLAGLITGRGVAQVMAHEGAQIDFVNERFEFLGRGYVGPVPAQVLLTSLVFGAALFVMREMSFGRYVMAVGGNERAARLAGVAVTRTKIAVYLTSALLAGVAGLIATARLGTADAANTGSGMELDAIAAVVVGGTPLSGGRATIGGTLVGALIMAIITTSFNMWLVPFAWSLITKAALLLFAVYIQRPKVA